MIKNNLTKGFIRLAVVLYVLVYLGLGILNFTVESSSFYHVDGHFSPFLCFSGDVDMFCYGNYWCNVIAEDSFLSKSEADRILIANQFFENEIKEPAKTDGYDVKELKEWFMKYASSNIESMKLEEHTVFDPEKNSADMTRCKYREIDLSKMPRRNIAYFFFQPVLFGHTFIGLLIIYIPILTIVFAIRWVYLGFKKR